LTAFLFVPAGLPLFFKDSQFAYDGLLGMYLPLVVFFVWTEAITFAMQRRLATEDLDGPPDRLGISGPAIPQQSAVR
jgi:hypothetical protein